MVNALEIHHEDKTYLFALHDSFQDLACKIGCSTAAASFLILGAIIVIAGAALCLTLPGVNVITDFILPGVCPGVLALLSSVPFIAYSVLHANEKNSLRKELLDFTIMLLNHHGVDQMDEEEAVTFIHEQFFKTEWTKEYAGRVISDLKERYPKEADDQTERQKALLKALDDTRGRLYRNRSERV